MLSVDKTPSFMFSDHDEITESNYFSLYGCELFQGDSLKLIQNIGDEVVDLVITDPPYNLGSHMKSRGSGVHRLRENHFSTESWDNLNDEEWKSNLRKMAQELFRVLKTGKSLVMFMSILRIETIKSIFEESGFYYKTTGIWHKKNPIPRNMKINFINSTECWIYFSKGRSTGSFNSYGKAVHDFVETGLTPMSEKKHGKHPTQKPIGVINFFINHLSSEGDTILDVFSGSGSTCIASAISNRNCIAFEMEEKYHEIAKKRLLDVKK